LVDTALHDDSENSSTPSRKQMWKNLAHMSWPCAVELLLASTISMINMAMVSNLGKEAVSAIGITNQPIMIPNVLLQAFCVGGTALVARSLGQGNNDQARRSCEQTMLLSLLFSLIFGVVLYFWGGTFVLWMGATDDYLSLAELYMRYSAIGVVFQSISTAVSAMLRGAGLTKLSMRFNIVSNIVNVVVGYVLINGFFFIPQLGLLGAAIAQLVAKVVGCAVALWILFTSHQLSVCPDIHAIFHPDFSIISRICRVGTSSALEQLTLRVGLIMFTIYIINLGTAEYAAHNIAGSLHSYVVNFGQAIGIALVSFVGQNLGSERPDIAEKYFREAILMGIVISIFVMIPLWFLAAPIASIFTNEPDVAANIVIALQILTFFVTGQVIQMIICGGLRGGGDTKWPLISTICGVLGMRMVMGYVLIVVMNLGLAGAWLSWFLDQNIRAVIIYYRFKGGKWKEITV